MYGSSTIRSTMYMRASLDCCVQSIAALDQPRNAINGLIDGPAANLEAFVTERTILETLLAETTTCEHYRSVVHMNHMFTGHNHRFQSVLAAEEILELTENERLQLDEF